MSRLPWVVVLVFACAAVCVPGVVEAQARAEADEGSEARELFYQGIALAEEARWAEALEAFEHSYELVPRASTQYNLANALFNLGRAVEAEASIARYLELAEAAGEPKERIAEAKELATLARRRSVTLRVHVSPKDATVTLDGREVPGDELRAVRVDPGDHVLQVTMAGYEPVVLRSTYPAGSRAEPEIKLAAQPGAPAVPSPSAATPPPAAVPSSGLALRRARWGLWATSATTLVAATAVGVYAIFLAKRVEDGCNDGDTGCDPREASTAKRSERLSYGADALLGVGVVAAISAVVLHWVEPRKNEHRAAPVISFGLSGLSAGVRLRLP